MDKDMYEVYLRCGDTERLLATMLSIDTATMLIQTWFAVNYSSFLEELVIKRMTNAKYEIIDKYNMMLYNVR